MLGLVYSLYRTVLVIKTVEFHLHYHRLSLIPRVYDDRSMFRLLTFAKRRAEVHDQIPSAHSWSRVQIAAGSGTFVPAMLACRGCDDVVLSQTAILRSISRLLNQSPGYTTAQYPACAAPGYCGRLDADTTGTRKQTTSAALMHAWESGKPYTLPPVRRGIDRQQNRTTHNAM
jgi:hypothetical protein